MPVITRRATLASLACFPAGFPALAQPMAPPGPITILIPFAAGGATDVLGRLIAGPMAARLGRPVTVENMPGGTGQLAAAALARGLPDGQVLMIGNIGTFAFNPHLFRDLGYDPLRDFAPVGLIGSNPMLLLASVASGITGIADLRARARMGRLSIGSAGRGSALHMGGTMLLQALGGAGELVAYAGGGPAMDDLQAGTLDVMVDQAITAIPATYVGVRALAVLGPHRLPELATVPTAAEIGLAMPGLTVWNMLVAPRGTPPDIIQALAGALDAALEDETLSARFVAHSVIEPGPAERGAVAAAALIRRDHEGWGRFIRGVGLDREG